MVGLKLNQLGNKEEANLYLVSGIRGVCVRVMATFKGENYVIATIGPAGIYLHNSRDLPFQVDDRKRLNILNEDIRRNLDWSDAMKKMEPDNLPDKAKKTG